MAEPASIRISRRLEWSDTDASGHWHFGAAFRLVEWAETALFEALGLRGSDYSGSMPRVHVEADFRAACRFRDPLDIDIEVADLGSSSVTFAARIARRETVCAEAKVVAVLRGPDGQPRRWSEEERRILLTAGPQPPELG